MWNSVCFAYVSFVPTINKISMFMAKANKTTGFDTDTKIRLFLFIYSSMLGAYKIRYCV